MQFGSVGEYLNIVIPIIRNSGGKKVLIVKRKNPIESTDGVFTWHFPGAIVERESDHKPVIDFVAQETGYSIKPAQVISSRNNHPLGHRNIYVAFKLASDEPAENIKPGVVEEFAWVDPQDLGNYFTTNIDTGVMEFLNL
ncbi:NUDIX domain-containing protein [bacterium]|nr:NUDIX domain-containing protein [bacterium]